MLEKCGVQYLRSREAEALPDLSEVVTSLSDSSGGESEDCRQSVEPNDELFESAEECPWSQAFADWSGPALEIVNWRDAERDFNARVGRADYNEQRRLNGVMDLLRSRGNYRKLITLPPNWQVLLDDLEYAFPNFWEVIDYLRGMCSLAEHRDSVVYFDPILLNGMPGCGKTYFAEELAQLVGAGSCVLRMETAQSNAALSGSADFWSNTKPGRVFTMLIERDYANACFILDEVEKCSSRDYDPMMSLLGLLEPSTACSFTDLSYPWLQLNASKLLWICTSNEADILPLPVLDRVKRFEIGRLTDDEARQMVLRTFKQFVSGLNKTGGALKLSSAAVHQLMPLSPRRIKRILREAVGRALYDERRTVLPRDIALDADALVDTRPPMGFL